MATMNNIDMCQLLKTHGLSECDNHALATYSSHQAKTKHHATCGLCSEIHFTICLPSDYNFEDMIISSKSAVHHQPCQATLE